MFASPRTLVLGVALLLALAALLVRRDADALGRPSRCDLTSLPRETEGLRRLALLVGVGDYASELIPDLTGPPGDVEAIFRLLTDPQGGYGFPPENVCVLVGPDATYAGVTRAFEEALIARARPGDLAVFYFSGHGTQEPDRSRDEPDEVDEALVLYDTWVGQTGALLDDQLNALLGRLHDRTEHIVLLLDACTSASVMRDSMRNRSVVRKNQITGPSEPAGGDGGSWSDAGLSGVVVLSAARDGSPALEPPEGGRGLFTEALLGALAGVAETPRTWSVVARELQQRVQARSGGRQQTVAQGALDAVVLEARSRARPLAWEVAKVGDMVTLEGLALPGWGVRAELRIYPGDARIATLRDPAQAKANLMVLRYSAVRAEAVPLERPRAPIVPGDIALLARPSPDAYRLELSLATSVDLALRQELDEALRASLAAAQMITVKPQAAWTLERSKGVVRLRGPEGAVRNTFRTSGDALSAQIVGTLLLHARQQALRSLVSEIDSELLNNQTLQVRVARAAEQPDCARGAWLQACPNQRQQIPLCTNWQVQVRNTHPSETLRVGGLILSSDGAMLSLMDGTSQDLPPGGPWVTLSQGKPMQSVPPVGAADEIMVFGTHPEVHVNWALLGSSDPAVTAGTRGAEGTFMEEGAWTVSSLLVESVASLTARVQGVGEICDDRVGTRGATIESFDVSPYRPADEDTALYRVLMQAEKLARHAVDDGIVYAKHDWRESTDEANLRRGMDGARAIWFAFTRAGLAYAPEGGDQEFVSAAEMFSRARGSCSPETPQQSPMSQRFESCLGDTFQTGDVLVWQGLRKDQRCVAYVAMVIDPVEFVGWGSRALDAAAGGEEERGDAGVEYQRMLERTWDRWDRSSAELKACWRHRRFIVEADRNRPADDPFVDGFACTKGACGAAPP